MLTSEHADGATCWFDLASPDLDASVAFYRAVFGWTATEGNAEMGGYRRWLSRGVPVGGMMPLMAPEQPAVWTIYLKVPDASDTAGRVVESGGSVLAGPMDAQELGRLAVLADPQGAAFGIWQPKELSGSGMVREPGSWAWSELATDDLDGAVAFYSKVFGWKIATPSPEYTEMSVGEDKVAGLMPRPEQMPVNCWSVYVTVTSMVDALGLVTESGGNVCFGPMKIEVGEFAQVMDPNGSMIGLFEPSA